MGVLRGKFNDKKGVKKGVKNESKVKNEK